jgi:hypothetical protein
VPRSPNRNGSVRPVQELPGRELLRLFLEQPAIWRALVRCPKCGVEAVLRPEKEGPAIPCIPAVKDEWEELRGRPEEEKRFGCEAPRPRFPAELAWLTDAWEKSAKPGRPFGARMHYRRAHVYGRLRAAGGSPKKIVEILTDPSPESRQRRYDGLPEPVRQFLGDFKNEVLSVDCVSGPEELRRSVQWARRQWSSPKFRLTGERVRTRRRPRGHARLS